MAKCAEHDGENCFSISLPVLILRFGPWPKNHPEIRKKNFELDIKEPWLGDAENDGEDRFLISLPVSEFIDVTKDGAD